MKLRILLTAALIVIVPAIAHAADASHAEAPQGEAKTIDEAETSTASHEAAPAHAEGDSGAHAVVHAPQREWHFEGMFGTYDKASMQRGLKVYREVCAACHSLKRIHFRNLEGIGYDESQIKTIANDYTINDGPNDDGDMFDRPGLPSDHFPSPYANDNAAKSVNNGALPPDLSLIIKARHDGANYVHALLNGYEEPPAGTVLQPGQNYNKYFPGHLLSMVKPLSDDQVAYEDGSPQTVEQYGHDVVNFLTWASDPYMEDRKRTGIKVLIFLAVFAGVMYGVKKKIWADVH